MATTNIFAGSITCDGLTNTGTTTNTGAVISDVGFVGPFLVAQNATGAGSPGNTMAVSATNGIVSASATGGPGGNASLQAGDGGNGVTGGAGGTVLIESGSAGTGGNANGGEIVLLPGSSTGSGVYGSVNVSGPLRSPTGLAQALTGNDQTITLPVAGFTKKVLAGSARTGTILPAGIADGQTLCIINTDPSAADTITFAVSATSRVADGVSAVIPGLRAMIFIWDAGTALWYRQGA